MKKVGIISGSGFIESDIIKLFLNQDFDVKISTADISIKENYQHLMELNNAQALHICELDEYNTTAIIDFVKDCDYIIHLNVNNRLVSKTVF
ncbi:hypothetical protein [uncultured Psychroserpens sp.]|uniref:hypothetical protein n=1 Tax=uncultured Psychroserpens sp. TaxID=255436 RepID=UPI00262138FC|nr:hypothetical protein [uncultured Psychroserpens sp.]